MWRTEGGMLQGNLDRIDMQEKCRETDRHYIGHVVLLISDWLILFFFTLLATLLLVYLSTLLLYHMLALWCLKWHTFTYVKYSIWLIISSLLHIGLFDLSHTLIQRNLMFKPYSIVGSSKKTDRTWYVQVFCVFIIIHPEHRLVGRDY